MMSSPEIKNIFVFASPKSAAYPNRLVPLGGAYRDRHGRGAGCGGRGSIRRANASRTYDAEAYGQVVWFWRPRVGVKSARRSAGDGGNKAWSPGRARSKP